MDFYVYFPVSQKATIHRAICPWCNFGKGLSGTGKKDDWRGHSTLSSAVADATKIAGRKVRYCGKPKCFPARKVKRVTKTVKPPMLR